MASRLPRGWKLGNLRTGAGDSPQYMTSLLSLHCCLQTESLFKLTPVLLPRSDGINPCRVQKPHLSDWLWSAHTVTSLLFTGGCGGGTVQPHPQAPCGLLTGPAHRASVARAALQRTGCSESRTRRTAPQHPMSVLLGIFQPTRSECRKLDGLLRKEARFSAAALSQFFS